MGEERVQYSTLEVAQNPREDAAKEVYSGQSDLPQVVPPPAGHEYYKPEYQNTQPSAYYQDAGQGGNSQYYQGVPQHPGQPEQSLEEEGKGKRIWGLAPRTFYIIAALVALGLIAAIVGGAVGGTLSKSNKSSSSADQKPGSSSGSDSGSGSGGNSGSNSTTSHNPESVLFVESRLSAVNWTDLSQYTHYAVFSQDKYTNLLASYWDSQNQSWSAVNVSDILAKSRSPISVKAGTPIAAATTGGPNWVFQVNVYYLTPNNRIGEIWSTDLQGLSWGVGALDKEKPKVAAQDSQMAALWHRCAHGCSQQLYVVYQDEEHNVNLINSSDWSVTNQVVPGVDDSTGLSLIPFATSNKTGTEFNAADMRLYFNVQGALREFKWNPDVTWEPGYEISTALDRNPPPQYAVSPFDGYAQVLAVARKADGSVRAERWDKESWADNEKIALRGGPGNAAFDYISMNGEGRFYGTMNSTIQEYRWDFGDPFTFIYVGTIPVPEPKKSEL